MEYPNVITELFGDGYCKCCDAYKSMAIVEPNGKFKCIACKSILTFEGKE